MQYLILSSSSPLHEYLAFMDDLIVIDELGFRGSQSPIQILEVKCLVTPELSIAHSPQSSIINKTSISHRALLVSVPDTDVSSLIVKIGRVPA